MKKIIALITLLFMLSTLFAACATPENPTVETTGNASEATSPVDTTSERLQPNLPEINYNGYKFRVLTRGTYSTTWSSQDIYAEKMTGSPINDAVYQRNNNIGEKYGFEIVEIASKNPDTDATNASKSQSDEYDMICIRMKDHISSLINNGYLYNLNEVPNLDLEQPYYDQSSIRDLSICGKLYCVTGDLLSMDNDATRCVLFNKTIADEIGLNANKYNGKDLYSLVEDGEWTIDALYEGTKLAARSLDGQSGGKLNPDTDVWGLETEPFNTLAVINAAGYRLISKDENDLPYYSCNNETCISILQKFIPMQNDESCVMLSSRYEGKYSPDIWVGLIHKTFTENRSLFYMAQLQNAKMFRSYDLNFGILPIPKYSNEQENYYSPVTSYGSNCISFPTTVADLDRNTVIIEALSCESRYTLQPAYYDVTLKGQTFSDEESGKMLDTIFENRLFDLGYMFNWGSGYSSIYSLTTSNSADSVASTLGKLDVATNRQIEITVNKIKG